MNRQPKNLSKVIDQIEISKDLDRVIADAIRRDRIERDMAGAQKDRKNWRQSNYRRVGAIAASLLIMFGAAVNTSGAFAQEMYKLPGIGALARLVTFREYTFEDENSSGVVSVPEFKLESNPELEEHINALISERVDAVLAEQAVLDAEYKEAFLATGGTEETFRKIETEVNYRLDYISQDIVSFMIWKYQTLAGAYNAEYYYNIDLDTGKAVTLKELLGEDFENQVKTTVEEEIKARMEADQNLVYNLDWLRDLKIDEERSYYVNEFGDIIVVFEKYEIAPGAMGKQEFAVGDIHAVN